MVTPSSLNKKVIVFGSTGPIGTNLIQIIANEQPSWQIVAVSRSGPQSKSVLASLKLDNVEIVKGDVELLEDVQSLTDSVDLVYCCIGFEKYERKYWAKHWPPVIDNLLAVTSETRPLVVCDNLYAYEAGINMSTSSKLIEASLKSKPAIRSFVHQKLQLRMDSQPKSVTCVGGADFFGPHVHNSFLGDTFFGSMVLKGQKPLAIATDKAIHDFCYAKDFANALYIASIHDRAYGRFWICPHSIHNMSMHDIATEVSKILSEGTTPTKVQVLPVFLVKMLAVVMPSLSEMKEMLPLWTKDYSVNDSEFCQEFDVEATQMREALSVTVEYYKKQKK